MIGQSISHYRIIEKLGEGGMGVVYKAEDTKLNRMVALKFLSGDFIRDKEAKERFLSEAQSAAALNHSSIVTIFEINEYEDQVYIAMELVDGINLKRKTSAGPLEIGEVFIIARQIAKGLREAHNKGVIHRDIKSANIMVTKTGQVKILDFGLARLKNQTGLTKAGATLGTIAYMSPEQTNGTDVDHRSDIWSLGVVLYELITRKAPFRGEYEQAIIYSILNEDPDPISTHRADVPEELEHILNKMLVKNPLERYQTAEHILADIKKTKEDSTSKITVSKNITEPGITSIRSKRAIIAVSLFLSIIMIWLFFNWKTSWSENKHGDKKSSDVNISQNGSKRKMIVVLPFENLGSPEDEYFADGIAEEITARLASLKGIGVIARISAKQYKNTTKSPQIIGKELGVDYILEGTIRWQRSNDKSSRIRITPQLIKTSDATHIWGKVYEKNLTDLFAIQAFIAEQVASSLDITILEGQRKVFSSKPTENMTAYNYYLRGNSLFNRDETEPTQSEALEMYKKAVELDPLFADAWASISNVHSMYFLFFFDRTAERLKKAKKAADKAFSLSSELPSAYMAMGYYFYCQMDFENAMNQFKKAEKGLGENSELLSAIGYVKRRQGHWIEAENYLEKAFKIDPHSYLIVSNLAETKNLLRNYPQSEKLLELALSLNPNNPNNYSNKILGSLLWKGDTDKGINFLNIANQKFSKKKNTVFLNRELLLHICSRNYQKALKLLSTFSKESIVNQFVFIPKALAVAQIHQLNKKPVPARKEFKKAKLILQKRIKENPEDSRLHSSFGITLAGLGEKDKAIKEGELGVKLMPINKEAYKGFFRLIDLAQIYTMVGAENKAIDQLKLLLSIPSLTSIPLLKIDPRWDLLRKNPRFIKLLKDGKQYSYIANDQ